MKKYRITCGISPLIIVTSKSRGTYRIYLGYKQPYALPKILNWLCTKVSTYDINPTSPRKVTKCARYFEIYLITLVLQMIMIMLSANPFSSNFEVLKRHSSRYYFLHSSNNCFCRIYWKHIPLTSYIIHFILSLELKTCTRSSGHSMGIVTLTHIMSSSTNINNSK